MNIQSETVRRYVLEHLEDGSFAVGKRLPGFRKIAEELNVSGPVVQNSLNTLVNEGILKAVPRSGLYVDPDWTYRRLQGCLQLYREDTLLPWVREFRNELGKKLPQLHISSSFPESPFQIIPTVKAQTVHEGMMDLMPILKECYPDLSLFHAEQLAPFMHDGRLTALPFLFSPRIVVCDREMLAQAGCKEPSPDWCIDDLLEIVRKLQVRFPGETVFRWSTTPGQWLNFVLNCGGQLFDPESPDPVKFDSPEARCGLRYYRLLHEGNREADVLETTPNTAVMVLERQFYGMQLKNEEDRWLFLPVPGDRRGHNGISIQATELLAIRRDGIDHNLIRPLIRYLWSEEFQDHLAELKYGIPIRRSSAAKSFSPDSSADAVFKRACASIRTEYQLYDENLFALMVSGMRELLRSTGDLDTGITDFAQTVRLYIKYMKLFPKNKRNQLKHNSK